MNHYINLYWVYACSNEHPAVSRYIIDLLLPLSMKMSLSKYHYD